MPTESDPLDYATLHQPQALLLLSSPDQTGPAVSALYMASYLVDMGDRKRG